jgi:hypothetical protein
VISTVDVTRDRRMRATDYIFSFSLVHLDTEKSPRGIHLRLMIFRRFVELLLSKWKVS